MTVFRSQEEFDFFVYKNDMLILDEWTNDVRDSEESWIKRYEHESEIICNIIRENNYKTILELGSGPGKLSQFIQSNFTDLAYTLIDKINAKKIFIDRNYKGTFLVKNLFNEFDISDIKIKYDLIIANDFLEHIANPSNILSQCYNISNDNTNFFMSIPNWRMGHSFINKGLFDFDNWIYFCRSHGWNVNKVFKSNLNCAFMPKLQCEEQMSDDLITSWNWYFLSSKTK